MTGKEMLQELIGQLSKVDPGPINISDKEEEIMDSVINCIPVYMPYASALFNNRAKSDRPKVIPNHSTNLAFTGEFVEQPYQMISQKIVLFVLEKSQLSILLVSPCHVW